MAGTQASFGSLIDSIYHVMEIEDYQVIECLDQVILESLQTPRRHFDWVVQIDPIIQRDDGIFFEIAVGLSSGTSVNGLTMKVEVSLIFGDELHQRLSFGEQTLRIGGGLRENGVVFPLKLAEAGVGVEDASKIPKYKQEGGRTTVKLSISIKMYEEIVVITL